MGSIGILPAFRSYDPVTPPEITSQAADLVTDKFEKATDYANDAFNLALGYIADMANLGNLHLVDTTTPWVPDKPAPVDFPTSLGGLNPIDPDTPEINEIQVAQVPFPFAPPEYTELEISSDPIPDMNIPLPDYLSILAPDDELPVLTATPPPQEEILIPEAPDDTLPPVPTLTEIFPPDEPDYLTHTFGGTKPTDDISAPDITYIYNEAVYSSEVRDALTVKLVDGIANGGPVLGADAEQAIYDRQKSRLEIDLDKNEQLALNDFASRGSRLPPGALVARLQDTQLQNSLALEDLSRDVINRSSELAYQSALEMIRQGLVLEQTLTDHSNNIQNRAFEAARLVTEFAIREYEQRIAAYSAKLEAYRIEAQVYESLIRGEAAKADLYRSVVQGRRLSIEMQQLTLQLYDAQLRGVATLVEIYKAKMEGARLHAEMYSINVDAYKTRIEAYNAEIGAVTAKYNLYQAKIAGEAEKVKLYEAQVKGYQAEVDAYRAKSEVDVNRVRAQVDQNRSKNEVFLAQLEQYKADIQAAVSNAEIQARNEGLKINLYDGEIRKFTAQVAALVDSYRAQSQIALGNAEIDIRYGDLLSRIQTAQKELDAEITKAQGAVASQLAAAALTSVSASAGLSYGQSRSDGTSLNVSDSQSSSEQRSSSESWSFNDTTIRNE